MYYVEWDSEINGVLLSDIETDLVSPRPVFFEELDLLGFDQYWSYPQSKNPLLWATGRRYFYKGELVATAKKGDALNLPEIKIEKEFEDLKLQEIDIEKVIDKNKEALFVLENDAIDLIEHVCDKYPNYPISISFSGGKDSQAVLDLVTRDIHSDNLTIIFSDTTLEHEDTYSTVEKTVEEYRKKFPNIKFEIAKPVKSSKELFYEMGLPSRFHRWCTPALKTAPYNKLINELVEPDSKIIVFEGVRAEESPQRSKYKQIADSVTHSSVINARPILYWNLTEVYLYNYYRNLPFNPLYRYGLSRVGCEICPYSSSWSECIHAHIGDRFNDVYIPLIKDYARNRGLSEEKDLNEFVIKGQWKKRAGGKGLNSKTSVEFIENKKNFKSISKNPTSNFLEWIKILGDISYQKKNDKITGEVEVEDEGYISFSLSKKEEKEIIKFLNVQGNIKLKSKLKKILKKSTYCIQCGVCDAECLEKALTTNPTININSNLCIHCENCIKFIDHGCYRAKSLYEGTGDKKMSKKVGIDRYSTFGLREQWLEEFFEFGEEWIEQNALGVKQVPAVKNWLTESELMDKDKKPTQLAKELKEIYKKDPTFVWGIIWINLSYNSKIINWYTNNLEWNREYEKEELLETLIDNYDGQYSKGTLNNALNATINTLDNSPLNDAFNIGILTKKGKGVKSVYKEGNNDSLNPLLIIYSLYKLKNAKSRNDFTITEIYDESFENGPYNQFGISQEQIEKKLRGMQQSTYDIIKVDLAADLDNIFLKDDVSTEDIVRIKKEEI